MSHIQNMWLTDINTNPISRNDCCGCSACASKCPKGAIEMVYDEEGFIYPKLDKDNCIDCGLCKKVCPLSKTCDNKSEYLKVFAGYSTNSDILMKTTSGGFITALSLSVIDQGGIVAGVRYSEGLIKSEYAIARTKDEVLLFSSSKYVQSEKKDIYREVEKELKKGNLVLFVGCPCDIQAIHNYLGVLYGTFLSVELVCMGVSSYKVAEAYKEYTERKYHTKLIRINARSKRKGWFVPHLEEEYENNQIRCSTLVGTFLGYGMQVYNRPSCFQCRFRGTNGVGDIRVGDFWGIKETDPYWNPNGVSCIFVRTQKGLDAVNSVKDFFLYETDYQTAGGNNQSFHSNKDKKYIEKREKFSQVFNTKGLIAACMATGTISFWVKHIVPDTYHTGLKRIYHGLVDKR